MQRTDICSIFASVLSLLIGFFSCKKSGAQKACSNYMGENETGEVEFLSIKDVIIGNCIFLKEEYRVNKTIKGACLVAATAMLPLSQAATAGEVNISGWVNEELFITDDGQGGDFTATEGNGITLGTRVTFSGTQELPNSGLTAGFEFSIEPGGNTPLLSLTQANANTQNGAFQSVNVLASNFHVSGSFGKITLGTQSMPTDNIGVLADPSVTLWTNISPVFRGNGYTIQGLGAGATNSTWASFLACATTGLGIGYDCNGIYRTGLRYDLPTFMGVNIAVGYANDDIYDIAAKWDGEVAGLKASLHGGYSMLQGDTVLGTEGDVFQVTGGLMDPGTGLFASVSYMKDEVDGAGAGVGDEIDSYYVKAGIKRDFNSLGPTAFSFTYGSYNDAFGTGAVAAGTAGSVSAAGVAQAASAAVANPGITGSEVERIAIGVTQYFGAGFQIYGLWEQLDLDVDCSTAACSTAYGGAEELDMFVLGGTYFF